jgi:LmbE family N-acetylglucosaminyl deacetylase
VKLRLGRPRCAIVVAPHPDDETIGAFGLISALRRAGTDIRVLVATDGGASHPNSATWPRARLVRERKRETLNAMAAVGLTANAIRFLPLPDGDLPAHARRCHRLIDRELRRARHLDLVVGPTQDDDHADHRIVARAISASRLPGVRRLGYQVWPAGAARRHRRTLQLGQGDRCAKRRVLRLYRTQTGRITDDPTGFAMSRGQLALFGRAQEVFRERRR